MRIVGVAKRAKRALTNETNCTRIVLICLLKCILNRKETLVYLDDIVYVNYPDCVCEKMYTLLMMHRFVYRYV